MFVLLTQLNWYESVKQRVTEVHKRFYWLLQTMFVAMSYPESWFEDTHNQRYSLNLTRLETL